MYSKESLKKYFANLNKAVSDFNSKDVNELKVTISKGNRKIGRVMNVSTAAGLTCGKWSHCIGYCYDIKAVLQYSNTVLPARAKNTVISRKDRKSFFNQINAAMDRRRANKYFRYHVSGEIQDLEYFMEMLESARKHPDFIVWTYTKMYSIVNEYCEKYGKETIPENMHIMFSEWDGMPLYNPYNFPIFTVKFAAGNKNHPVEFFDTLYKCPGNCDICKECGRGCIAGENTYADEH